MNDDDYDYDYDYTPPPLVDEIQAQYQLPTPARILSAPALQVWAAEINVVERLN